MKPLKLYWSGGRTAGRKNFGDAISPVLVSWLAGREVEYAGLRGAELVAVGSLLHRLPCRIWSRRLCVWGAGYIEARSPHWTPHRYAAVRGAASAALLKNRRVAVLGDPGILVARRFPQFGELRRRRPLGVVLHYKDRENPAACALLERFPGSVPIDILAGIEEVLRAIGECRRVVSSSLHGLIAADALGVPNAWLRVSDAVRGGDFKFRDYYSAFGLEGEVSPWTAEQATPDALEEMAARWRRPGLERIQRNLIEAFPFPG